jgi:hypothetical protein
MKNFERYDFITKTATIDGQCKTNKEAMMFHYFNVNGLVKRKHENDLAIAALVDAGVVRSGWHLAYGTFSDYEENSIIRLAGLKRVGSVACRVAINMMEDHCANQESKILEAQAA